MKDETQIPPHNSHACAVARTIIGALREEGRLTYQEFENLCVLLTMAGIDIALVGHILMGMHSAKWIRMIGESDRKEDKTLLPGPNIPTMDLGDLHVTHLIDAVRKLAEEEAEREKLSN